MARPQRVLVVALVSLVASAAVTGGGVGSAATDGNASARSRVEVVPLGTSGSGVAANSRAADLAAPGYDELEYTMSGEATVYTGSSAGPIRRSGPPAPYTTRLLVRAPSSPADFSGRVMVEPFNTSAARDNDAAWGMIGAQLLANGDAWVGVTVRYSAVDALKTADAARYAALDFPTNGHAWDILSEVGRLVRADSDANPLRGLPVEHVYMSGYSQSAVDAVTYANAINPRARRSDGGPVYDGYLLMGRAASATPLDSGTDTLPKLETRPVGTATSPIVQVESQSDVQGFTTPQYTNPGGASVRRKDSDAPRDRYRLYEIPGSAHAARIPSCDHQGTTFPLRYFERAALMNLYRWAERDVAPPRAPRIGTTAIDTVSALEVDADGNAVGGIRSPYLDVPLARYEGTDTPGPLCGLAGVETPLDPATLATRYDGVDDYMGEFAASLDEAIQGRRLLRSDREVILAETRAKAEPALASA